LFIIYKASKEEGLMIRTEYLAICAGLIVALLAISSSASAQVPRLVSGDIEPISGCTLSVTVYDKTVNWGVIAHSELGTAAATKYFPSSTGYTIVNVTKSVDCGDNFEWKLVLTNNGGGLGGGHMMSGSTPLPDPMTIIYKPISGNDKTVLLNSSTSIAMETKSKVYAHDFLVRYKQPFGTATQNGKYTITLTYTASPY
jgi:hypothetical protein